jgi:hypothetical protein
MQLVIPLITFQKCNEERLIKYNDNLQIKLVKYIDNLRTELKSESNKS